MMAHTRSEITHIQSANGNAFLNVADANGEGISVQAHCYKSPIYLVQRDSIVELLTFASLDWAKEWFAEQEAEGRMLDILWLYEPDE